jgi:hypothetical protein
MRGVGVIAEQGMQSEVLAQMHARLGHIHACLMALTVLQEAQLGGIVAILLRQ